MKPYAVLVFLTWLSVAGGWCWLVCPPIETDYVDLDPFFRIEIPQVWVYEYQECGGSRQSPIALSEEIAIRRATPPLKFHHYDMPFQAIIKNTGTTVKVRIGDKSAPPTITGGTMCNNEYMFMEFHGHWGSSDIPGAEHTIEDEIYDFELQLVYKKTLYGTMADALKYNRGVAIFAILFTTNETAKGTPSGISKVCDALPSIEDAGSEFVQDDFKLESVMEGLDLSLYYSYMGSLTTPPCSEVVLWNVFTDVLHIDRSCLESFFKLRTKYKKPLQNNFRPLQSEYDRVVFYRTRDVERC